MRELITNYRKNFEEFLQYTEPAIVQTIFKSISLRILLNILKAILKPVLFRSMNIKHINGILIWLCEIIKSGVRNNYLRIKYFASPFKQPQIEEIYIDFNQCQVS